MEGTLSDTTSEHGVEPRRQQLRGTWTEEGVVSPEAEQRSIGNAEVIFSVTSAEGFNEIGTENFPLHLETRSL